MPHSSLLFRPRNLIPTPDFRLFLSGFAVGVGIGIETTAILFDPETRSRPRFPIIFSRLRCLLHAPKQLNTSTVQQETTADSSLAGFLLPNSGSRTFFEYDSKHINNSTLFFAHLTRSTFPHPLPFFILLVNYSG